jgi:hypothetical protein
LITAIGFLIFCLRSCILASSQSLYCFSVCMKLSCWFLTHPSICISIAPNAHLPQPPFSSTAHYFHWFLSHGHRT